MKTTRLVGTNVDTGETEVVTVLIPESAEDEAEVERLREAGDVVPQAEMADFDLRE